VTVMVCSKIAFADCVITLSDEIIMSAISAIAASLLFVFNEGFPFGLYSN